MSTPRSEFVKSAPWYSRATALSREDIMTIERRTFLKSAGLTMGAGVLGPSVALAAQSTPAPMAGGDMPKGMTFVTIKRGQEMSLGIKTDRGILDVKRAEAQWKQKAPTTIDEVFQRGGGQALQRLVDKAQTGGLFLAEDKIEYGPCVTNPEKIICIGLNYRKHAAETGNPVPKAPILFNKALREVVWVISDTCGYDGTVRSPAACR